ncbi:aspartic peptidase domain-containing protein [Amanita rubescens]|nr:aspartic peptidase domain-containing protein [Amanita rubescens]
MNYTASVEIGAGTYTLLVDTANANTWIGANQRYQPSPSSQDTGETVKVSYGSGSFSGEEFMDTVRLGSLVIQGQSFGVASTSSGFTGLDGVLGIGPVDLSQGTTSGGGTVPTVTDNAFSQGSIDAHMIGISFEPTTLQTDQNGELTWASTFWGIDQSITYGSSGTPILSTTAGIVDTATTMILIASDAFTKYQQATGATKDSTTDMLTLTSSQFSNLESLFFHIGGTTFELTANAQIWPRALNTAIGGTAGNIYLIVGDKGSKSSVGLDFVNGYTFLERFYTVYDTGNQRVGFATTPHTFDTTN